MSLRFDRLLTRVLLLSALTACGDDDVTPPPDTDGGTTDAGLRDGAADGGAGRSDAGDCTDEDGDGHGALPCGDDCDDTDASRFPGNTEACDGDDEDCNDTTYGPDADADGFASVTCCNGTDNCGADCNDAAVNANPDADEICNGGIDDDCNGIADLADGVCVPCGGGFTGFDGECTDVDECSTGAPCGGAAGTTCANTDGSYTCNCPTGYGAPAMRGTCIDVDECATGTDDCTDAATCANTIGSFTCACPPATPFGTGHGPSGCLVRFTDLGDGTVRDNARGLLWQQGLALGEQSQAASVTYCNGLALDGGGWRLPTKDELLSVVDLAVGRPTIDTLFFPGTPSAAFWSSSPVVGSPSEGWVVYFYDGLAYENALTDMVSARCVR